MPYFSQYTVETSSWGIILHITAKCKKKLSIQNGKSYNLMSEVF